MKKFLNESLNRIEKMLVEEGYVELGKAMIEEAFKVSDRVKDYGKVAAGGLPGAVGAALGLTHADEINQALAQAGDAISNVAHNANDKIADLFHGNEAAPHAAANTNEMSPAAFKQMDYAMAKIFLMLLMK